MFKNTLVLFNVINLLLGKIIVVDLKSICVEFYSTHNDYIWLIICSYTNQSIINIYLFPSGIYVQKLLRPIAL